MFNVKAWIKKVMEWLKVYKPATTAGMDLYSSEQTSQVGVDVPASGTSVIGQFRFRETNTDATNFALETFKTAADNYYVQFMTRRLLADGTWSTWNGFQIGVDTSGGKYVNFRDSAGTNAWRTALGLGTAIVQSQVESKSVPTAKDTNLASVSLPAGVYVVQGVTSIASNTTGRREIHFTTTSGGTATSGGRYASSGSINANTGITYQNFMSIFTFSATTTLYLVAYQNSGSSLRYTSIGIRAFKIG